MSSGGYLEGDFIKRGLDYQAFRNMFNRLSGLSREQIAQLVLTAGGEDVPGVQTHVLEEVVDLAGASAVFVEMSEAIPAGHIILSVQSVIEELVVAAGNSTRVGIGPSGTVVKYGVTTNKTLNQKTNALPTRTLNASAETIRVNAVQADGTTAGTGQFSAGKVRVRVVYEALNPLPSV